MSRKISIDDDLLKVFETVPELYLILSPDLLILTASNAYLEATLKLREEIVGKFIFDAFPDNPATPQANAVSNLQASLKEVLITGKPHQMALQRYDVPKPGANGGFEKKYWQPLNTPVLGEKGELLYIIHKAVDVTDQLLARKKAEESEHQVRSIIESSPFPLGVYLGKEMRIQFANQAVQDAWGKGPDVIGKRFRDVLPELEDQSVFEELDRVFETGIPYHSRHNPMELLVNGQLKTFYFNYSFTPLFNAAGEVYGIMSSGSDDTELILARQRVEESESRFRSMVEQAPIAIALTRGRDHFIENMNAPMLRIVGRDKEEIVGMNLIQAMPETKDEPFLKIVDSVLQTGEAYNGHAVPITYRLRENTVQRYFNLSYTPLKELGEVTGVLHVAVDVTEQVEENKKELKRFKFMADQALDSFILMREDGSFAYLNNNTLEAWRYTEEEMQHLHMADIDPVYDQEAFMQLFTTAQKEAVPQFEALHKTKEGNIFPVEVNMVGLTLGDTPYLFAIARDITKRKQAEQEMKVSNFELKRINNDLDNFIYTASHDLKAPIYNIEGLLHALLQNLSPDTLALDGNRHITSLMQESVERFKKTIANLTDVVKLQKENNAEAALVNLSEVMEGVRLDLDQVIQSSGAEIEIDIADCPTVHFSEKNLRSVVYNLLSNAIKYRSPGRVARVQISCKVTTDYHVLSVKDNGRGMDTRHVDQLFGMFTRFHADIEGTGIGLYMAKKMVENAGGHIEVESTLGIGTTFQVFFPCKQNI